MILMQAHCNWLPFLTKPVVSGLMELLKDKNEIEPKR